METRCGDFTFFSNFDSGNLYKVELVSKVDIPNERHFYEYNLWTKPDCYGTNYQNFNRSWFYFGVKDVTINSTVKLSIKNLNRQYKMFTDGMAPVYRIIPNRVKWTRIKDTLNFFTEKSDFVIQFNFKTSKNPKAVYYFAFTYPFSYFDSQKMLKTIDKQFKRPIGKDYIPGLNKLEDIYYYREILCYSLQNRRIDLITISSYHGIIDKRESRLHHLFPENNPRPYGFDKKVIFISARVHPGETPSSFVFNGILKFLLSDNSLAKILRRLYVFKLIPMLNPDGVACGHYRTDTRGINLNRVYNNPDFALHPSIYAAKAMILFHNNGYKVSDLNDESVSKTIIPEKKKRFTRRIRVIPKLNEPPDNLTTGNDKDPIYFSNKLSDSINAAMDNELIIHFNKNFVSFRKMQEQLRIKLTKDFPKPNNNTCSTSNPNKPTTPNPKKIIVSSEESTKLFLYLDLHGHASKKGIFMYGNYFDNIDNYIDCMLYPKLMSINSKDFHFSSCNFSKKNMFTRDRKEGGSKEGCGRVSILRSTGIIRSYTLECNYNTGNSETPSFTTRNSKVLPPKYGPRLYEQAGRSLVISILDLTSSNPLSRLSSSEYRTLNGIKIWLRNYIKTELAKNNAQLPSPSKTKIQEPKEKSKKISSDSITFEIDKQKKENSPKITSTIKKDEKEMISSETSIKKVLKSTNEKPSKEKDKNISPKCLNELRKKKKESY